MSSIERAMSKLGGDDEEVAVDGAPAEPAAMAEAAAEPPRAAPQPGEPAPSVATAPAIAPPPVVAPTAATVVVPSVPAPQPAEAIPAASTRNFVTIDLERMGAAGFLVPDQPMNRQSEEYQHIKRRLLGNMVPGILQTSNPPNLILITSSVPGEGKTFTSTNLAISIAMEVDHTVLAVDTDIMKRDLSKVFGVSDRRGLFDLLSDSSLSMPDLLVRTSIPNLVLLPAGNRREGSTELLASQRMRELTAEISSRYHDRVILFDSPPVLATTTATALAPLVGQVVLVAEAGKTKQETVREALNRLEHVRVTGVILNKAKQAVVTGYDYYGYGYYNAVR